MESESGKQTSTTAARLAARTRENATRLIRPKFFCAQAAGGRTKVRGGEEAANEARFAFLHLSRAAGSVAAALHPQHPVWMAVVAPPLAHLHFPCFPCCYFILFFSVAAPLE